MVVRKKGTTVYYLRIYFWKRHPKLSSLHDFSVNRITVFEIQFSIVMIGSYRTLPLYTLLHVGREKCLSNKGKPGVE